MYSIHPTIGVRIANQMIDERVRDAEARRIARVVSREARLSSDTPTLRSWRRRLRLSRRRQTSTADVRRAPTGWPTTPVRSTSAGHQPPTRSS